MAIHHCTRIFPVSMLGLVCGLAQAAPVEYTLTLPYADVVIGDTNYAYNNYSTKFIFDGDDSNVVTALFPTGPSSNLLFSAIYQGSAKVEILNGTQVVASAVFAPNQVVVSADSENGGLGFGFVPGGIGASGFDPTLLQPLYPGSITNYGRGSFGYDQNYNLTLAFAAANAGQTYPAPSTWPVGLVPFQSDGSADIFGAVFSCNGFNGFLFAPGCTAPAPIATDLGNFTINPLISLGGIFVGNTSVPLVGEFTARPLVTSVPEPATAQLAALGLMVLVVAARSRPRGAKREA